MSTAYYPQSMKDALRFRRELRGWASRTERDRVGDVVEAGAFSRAQAMCGKFTTSQALYLNHAYHLGAIGEITDYFESSKGLYIHARLNDGLMGNRVLAAIEACLMEGVLPGLSIGPAEWDYTTRGNTRYATAVVLKEISLVLPPAVPVNRLCVLGPP